MGRIIVIEDNPVFRDHVCGMLEKAGYETRTAYDCAGARRLLAELDEEDIILSDLRLPDGECTEVLERMRETGIRNPFVIMTDYAQVASAVSSMRLGAEDYIPKTLLQEKLLPRIRELVRKTERRHTVPILERRSAAFRTIDRRISLVAPTDIGVLILGENGTGKEHIAEKIHAQSTRQKGPFVAIDCGMLTRELAASELFGYEKGAFTGAITGKKGCMAEADGGTLFLDEVGDIPLPLQVKLLRLLETGTYRRVGSTELRHADLRVVSATHRNLPHMVAAGRFREDLYYRLSTFPIHLPPLRERQGDIALLARALLERVAPPRRALQLSGAALALLEAQPYPGNVRELRNIVIRLTARFPGQTVDAATLREELDLDDETPNASGTPPAGALSFVDTALQRLSQPEPFRLDRLLATTERSYIEAALRLAHGNVSQAARLLGINRTTLYHRMDTTARET